MIAWFYNRIWMRHIFTRPCHGCDDDSIHDAHMTRLGWWWLIRNQTRPRVKR